MRIARFLMISAFAAVLALPAIAEAQSAGVSRPRRPVFNPFSALARSRFATSGRFTAASTTTTASETASTAGPSVGGSSFQAALLPLRPPFRPPVRSPFRPPPRPPF